MTFNAELIKPRILEALRTGNLIPFIGAGVSRQAMTKDPTAFPTWIDLIKIIMRRALEDGDINKSENEEMELLLERGKHLMVAQALKHEMGDKFLSVVADKCSPIDAEPGPIHRKLFQLKCPLIVTTNYDCLLEDACLKELKKRARTVTFEEAAEVQHFLQGSRDPRGRPMIFKIHGTVEHDAKNIVITETDYRDLLYHKPGYRTILSALFVTRVVLMIGFSYSDPELTVLTESLRESLKNRAAPDYLVLEEGLKGPVEKRRLHEDFGLEVIEYGKSPEHAELLEFVDHLVHYVESRPAEPLR